MSDQTEVTLITCRATKRSAKAAAKNLYDTSAYFRKMRAWAKSRGVPWFIMSAKHGLLHPETEVAPYESRGVDGDLARDMAVALSAEGVEVVHVCAGRDYLDPLTPKLERRGIDVVEHFAGQQIGERMKNLAEATE